MNRESRSWIDKLPGRRAGVAVLCGFLSCAGGSAAAAPEKPEQFTWNSPASGTWSDASKWTDHFGQGSAPAAPGDKDYTFHFGVPGAYTATNDLEAELLLNRLVFEGSEVTLDGNAIRLDAAVSDLPQFRQNSFATVEVRNPVNLDARLTVDGSGGGTVVLSGLLYGQAGLTKTHPGRLYLTAANTYQGTTIIGAGILSLGRGAAGDPLGQLPFRNAVRMSNAGALLDLGGKFQTIAWLSGVPGTGVVTHGELTLDFDDFPVIFSGVISGTGALVKRGSGIQYSRGLNTYSGNTTVAGGTLQFDHPNPANDASTVTVEAGAELDLNFTGADQVAALVLGGQVQPDGLYDASNSGGAIVGDGALRVVSQPGLPEIAVDEPAGIALANGASRYFGAGPDGGHSLVKTFIVRNAGTAPLESLQATIGGPHGADFALDLSTFPPSLAPGGAAEIGVTFAPGGGGERLASLSIASNDADENPFVVNLSGTRPEPPVILVEPADQELSAGSPELVLSVVATGIPAPSYQWYVGQSGDTSRPLEGLGPGPQVTLPVPAAAARYWVRVASTAGTVDSRTATVSVPPPPSSNPNLSGLTLTDAGLSPAFAATTGSYSASVPHGVASIRVTPTAEDPGATIRVNGTPVASGSASAPVAMAVGINSLAIEVTAEDGIARRNYSVIVVRAPAAQVATLPAGVAARGATLKGRVVPNGAASAFFEFGSSPALGQRTPDQEFSGNQSIDFEAEVGPLLADSSYFHRAVVAGPGGLVVGETLRFTTAPEAPIAATGAPSVVSFSAATLIGAVNPNGLPTSVYFEFGLTPLYGQSTPVQLIPAGQGIVDVQAPNGGLIPNSTYHYRLVASNAAGTAFGDDVVFTAEDGGGTGSTVPVSQPVVVTGDAVGIASESAILRGTVNPRQGTSIARFEYGPTPGYGRTSTVQGVGNGNGNVPAAVALEVRGLLPGTTYHYRLTGTNSLGQAVGEDATFTTRFAAPSAVTGDSVILTRNRVRVSGEVRPRGPAAEVWIDYGTDGATFDSVRAEPPTLSGDGVTAVSAELGDLAQGVTYHYRVRAVGPGGEGRGQVLTFDVAALSGLIQQFPPPVDPADRQGSVAVVLSPAGIGGGWRFAGEQFWRNSGTPAAGLTDGDRVIEYRPVAGHVQPPSEAVAVRGVPQPTVLERGYVPAAAPGGGSLTVTLKPQDLTEGIAPARWRFFGEGEDDWKESGTTVSGLAPGNHVILSKEVAGRTTPPPVTATVVDGETSDLTITYYLKEDPVGSAPAVLSFEDYSRDPGLPFAFVGQLRGDAGSASGFVVRPRVVATAGHVVFDDGTLSATTGMQWLFQRDRDVHEPAVATPRGYYLLTGYAAQRVADNSPGTSTPQSQNLDAATLYFLEEAGRGGFSGFLASDADSNEHLLSRSLKTLAGYPIDEVPAGDLDRMHATPPADLLFSKAFGRTYLSRDIRASGGASGGPLCVRGASGVYYPAAIYLGGTNQTVVRAIDGDVVDLIGFADASAGDGVGVTGGTLLETATSPSGSPDLASLEVQIEPAAARAAGAGWRINTQAPYRTSGERLDSLDPNTYTVRFPTVEGFLPPTPQVVAVDAGLLTTLRFRYEPLFLPPVITSAGAVSVVRGDPLDYRVEASPSPDLVALWGQLPAGLAFDPGDGRIEGLAQESGVFQLTLRAVTSGGADSKPLVISSLPALAPQALTAPYREPLSYAIASSESGAGVIWTAGGLPPGLVLDPATGVVSGTPDTPGVFEVPVTVTVRGASSASTVTFTITGEAPVIMRQPEAAPVVEYGGRKSLGVEASGLPEPGFQWFEGASGDTSAPVAGANAALFTTPPLFGVASYWVRVSNISGSVDSEASVVALLPSTNANLSELLPSTGVLAPAFNPGIRNYTMEVPNHIAAMTFTPTVEVPQSTVRINGNPVPSGSASLAVALLPGLNNIPVEVTSGNGATVRIYTLRITRAAPPVVSTGVATDLSDRAARLRGSATPNGPGTVFFQYGLTTDYGDATPGQEVSGGLPLDLEAAISGLAAETTYHYRIGLTTAGGTVFGADLTLLTGPAPALAATGDAAGLATTEAILIGAVDPKGLATEVRFDYGETAAYGKQTPVQIIPAGNGVTDVRAAVAGLTVGLRYHYRLVASSLNGTVFGDDVTFIAGSGSGGDGLPLGPPNATTGGVLDVTATSALLQASVTPNGGTTFVRFDYGPTPAYGSSTVSRGIGNGGDPAAVILEAGNLLPGKTYHYRVVATNSLGTRHGEDASFTTRFLAPLATTGDPVPLTLSSATLTGAVRARGAAAEAFFEYGTDGVTFPNRVPVAGGTVNGDGETPVQAELINLPPGVRYHYRLGAARPGDPASIVRGEVESFAADALFGLVQRFPREVPAGDRQGQLRVNLQPAGAGGWRFAGDKQWRAPGSTAGGLTTGDREIEFQPRAGFIQPPRELVGVVSGAPALVLEREYLPSAVAGNATLRVLLEPAALAGPDVPASGRLQWRLAGDSSAPWRDSGELAEGLMAGSYLVELKPVAGMITPPAAVANAVAGVERVFTFTYDRAGAAAVNPPRVVTFATASTSPNLPYAHVGQVRNDAGSHSGFVVKPRVVATTARAIFDEASLAQIPGMEWLLQRDRETHEPKPLVPRGFYVFDGYAARRSAENTPGTLSPEAQDFNVAAMYFLEDAGRGGFSGFLASDDSSRPLLEAADLKILAGYPVHGVSPAALNRMHATLPAVAAFTPLSATLFATPAIRGFGGMAGGPLCVQRAGGAYYPAGIYLGGTPETLVRAIDSGVIDLFNRAEITSATGDNNNSGGISQTGYSAIPTSTSKGALTVILEPAAARVAGALWKLGDDSGFLASGSRKNNLNPGSYLAQFRAVAGFQPPDPQPVVVVAGNLTTLIFTYQPVLSALESWRVENFGAPANQGLASDSEDPDGDGSLNLDEYTAGTDPHDPADRFKIGAAALAGTTFTVEINGKAGRTYTLQHRTDLAAGTWDNVSSTGPVAADGSLSLSDPAAATRRGFYRVLVVWNAP
jgi:autotransporter-associated beta strand protein